MANTFNMNITPLCTIFISKRINFKQIWTILSRFELLNFFFSTGKFACKILIQGFSYAFPVNLTIPVAISLLIAACGLRNGDPCFFHNVIPDYLFFESPPVYFLNDFITRQVSLWSYLTKELHKWNGFWKLILKPNFQIISFKNLRTAVMLTFVS